MGFLLEYLKNPRFIGAVAPSGINLSRRMIRPINFKKAKVIVEYGPGTGSFTRELVIHRNPGTALLLIERNPLFCDELKKLFENQPNIHIINGDAENVSRYLDEHSLGKADCIVSGLPFNNFPAELSERIMRATRDALKDGGKFITFQYTLMKKRFFMKYFNITGCTMEMKNLPPAYVIEMTN